MVTLRQWANSKKWRFYEARMIPIWNELDQFLDTVGVNGGSFTFGTQTMGEMHFVTNCVTPVVQTTPDAGQLSTISGGVAVQKAPPSQFRVGAVA